MEMKEQFSKKSDHLMSIFIAFNLQQLLKGDSVDVNGVYKYIYIVIQTDY